MLMAQDIAVAKNLFILSSEHCQYSDGLKTVCRRSRLLKTEVEGMLLCNLLLAFCALTFCHCLWTSFLLVACLSTIWVTQWLHLSTLFLSTFDVHILYVCHFPWPVWYFFLMSLAKFAQLTSPECPQPGPNCQCIECCPFLWPYQGWLLCCLNTDQKWTFKRASHCLQSDLFFLYGEIWKIPLALSFSLWRCLWSSHSSEEEGGFLSWIFSFTWSAFLQPITKAILLFL